MSETIRLYYDGETRHIGFDPRAFRLTYTPVDPVTGEEGGPVAKKPMFLGVPADETYREAAIARGINLLQEIVEIGWTPPEE